MTVIESIEAGDREALEAALAADPQQANARNSEGVPALRMAVYFGRKEMVAALRQAGAVADPHTAAALGEPVEGDLAAYSSDGWTPLHLAAFFGHPRLVADLIARGASVTARSTNALQNLPIHAAAAGKCRDCVKALIEAGSPVNDKQQGGFTPLHSAAQNGDVEMAKMLKAAGADPSLLAGAGKSPIDLAREKGFDDLVRALS